MFTYFVVLIVGFAILYYGAEWLVEGAADVASHLKLARSFVGLTVVAFGTSAPEFIVNVIAASRSHTEFALANVAGSNLTNLCIGFGLVSLFAVVPLQRGKFGTDLTFFSLAPCLVVMSFAVTKQRVLSYWALIPFLICLLIYLFSLSKRRAAPVAQDPNHATLVKPVRLLILGGVLLYVGGEIVFRSAVELAQHFHLPESIIGLTVVACGTSIPDVAASVAAARRGEYEIAAGNLLGSNISNVLIVLGATLIFANESLASTPGVVMDYVAVAVVSITFLIVMFIFERVTRLIGGILLAIFFAYLTIRIGMLLF